MKPEFNMLLSICGKERGLLTKVKPFPESTGHIDEEKLLSLAERHHVCGLLYRGLKSSPGILSEQGIKKLKMRAMINRVYTDRLLHEWPKAVRAVERSGTPILSFKGPALALQLYNAPDAREYGDLDFFINLNKKNLNSLLNALEPLGYKESIPAVKLSEARLYKLKRNYDQFRLRNDEKEVSIEIHSQESGSFQMLYSMPVDDLFQRAQSRSWQEQDFLCFGKEDHTTCIFAHGAKHAWSSLHWILDAAEILNDRWHLDWPAYLNEVRYLGLERVFTSSINLVTSLFDIQLPKPLSNFEVGDYRAARNLSHYSKELLQNKVSGPTGIRAMARFNVLYRSRLKREMKHKIKTFTKLIVPTNNDFEMISIPEAFLFLYWIIRPILVIIRRFRA
jgi:hypothetical protein